MERDVVLLECTGERRADVALLFDRSWSRRIPAQTPRRIWAAIWLDTIETDTLTMIARDTTRFDSATERRTSC
jgi:hypothetical protein